MLCGRATANPAVSFTNPTVFQNSSFTLPINVTDSGNASVEDIEGMTFTFQIGNGAGSTPSITSLDMITGTIWSGHTSASNVVTPTGGNNPQFQVRDLITDTAGDFVNANGLLGTVTISTAGAAAGAYDLKMIGTAFPSSDSKFYNGLGGTVTSTFFNGTLTVVVPEPSSMLLMFAAVALVVRRSRR
jgi:hypothetical protein